MCINAFLPRVDPAATHVQTIGAQSIKVRTVRQVSGNEAKAIPVSLFAASLAADALFFSVVDKPRTIAVLGLSLLFAHGVKGHTLRHASVDSAGISTDQFVILFLAVLSLKALTIE